MKTVSQCTGKYSAAKDQLRLKFRASLPLHMLFWECITWIRGTHDIVVNNELHMAESVLSKCDMHISSQHMNWRNAFIFERSTPTPNKQAVCDLEE